MVVWVAWHRLTILGGGAVWGGTGMALCSKYTKESKHTMLFQLMQPYGKRISAKRSILVHNQSRAACLRTNLEFYFTRTHHPDVERQKQNDGLLTWTPAHKCPLQMPAVISQLFVLCPPTSYVLSCSATINTNISGNTSKKTGEDRGLVVLYWLLLLLIPRVNKRQPEFV